MLCSHPLSPTPAPSARRPSSIIFSAPSSFTHRDSLFHHLDAISGPKDSFGTQKGLEKDSERTRFFWHFLAPLLHNPAPNPNLQKTASQPLSRYFFSHPAHPPTNNQQRTTAQPKTTPRGKTKLAKRTQIPLYRPKNATFRPRQANCSYETSPPRSIIFKPPPPRSIMSPGVISAEKLIIGDES
jgi:hypothetical protein